MAQSSELRTFASSIGARGSTEIARRARRIAVPPSIDRLPPGPFQPLDELTLLVRLVRIAIRERVMVLFSTRGRLKPELLCAVFVGLWPKRFQPKIILFGEMFAPDSGVRGVIQRWLIKLADRGIFRYTTYSSAERDVFARLWDIDRAKIRVVPLVFEPDKAHVHAAPIVPRRLFAGGNSLRDYAPLVAAARMLPECEFVLATKLLSDRHDLPPNVTAGPLPQEEFYRAMDQAAIVVIPVKTGLSRGAGHMTYQAAMWRRKPTIVTEALGVHDYIHDRETGFIVDGSAAAYVDTIRWILDERNADQVRQIAERAHQAVVEQFSPESFGKQLLRVVDEAWDAAASTH